MSEIKPDDPRGGETHFVESQVVEGDATDAVTEIAIPDEPPASEEVLSETDRMTPTSDELGAASQLLDFAIWNRGKLAVIWVRAAVPVCDDVAITVESHQRTRARLGAEAHHQGQIPTGGMADHGDTLRVYRE